MGERWREQDGALFMERGELARRLCAVRELVPGVRDVARQAERVVALTDGDGRIEVALATGEIHAAPGGARAERVLRAVRAVWEAVLADVLVVRPDGSMSA